MKKNPYLKKYIDLQNQLHGISDKSEKLIWEDEKWGIKIQPEHGNYFSFRITTNQNGSTLQVEKARELAKWLLEVTDGLEDTNDIIEEIRKK